jgi:membrane protein DedA with SNARE-associated domain
MAELVNDIALLVEALVLAIGYPGIIAVMLLENLVPPIPTDPLLPFAGILAAQGQMHVLGVWASAVFGALLGSLALYGVGRRLGEPFVRTLIRRYGRWLALSEAELDRAVRLINRHGAPFVLIGRSIPVLRSLVSLAAGVSRMRLPLFLLFSGFNSLVVTGIWVWAGYLLGENWRDVLGFLDRFEPLLTPLIIIGVSVMIGAAFFRRMRASARPKPLPHEAGD